MIIDFVNWSSLQITYLKVTFTGIGLILNMTVIILFG